MTVYYVSIMSLYYVCMLTVIILRQYYVSIYHCQRMAAPQPLQSSTILQGLVHSPEDFSGMSQHCVVPVWKAISRINQTDIFFSLLVAEISCHCL